MNRFAVFAVALAVIFAIVYPLGLHFHWELFSYNPGAVKFEPFSTPKTMHWYGLTVTAAIIGGLGGLIASRMPEPVMARFWPGLAWVVPLCSMLSIALLILVVGD